MKKRTGTIVIILSIILTVLLGYTAIVGWGETGTGSMRNIKTGLDLSGGVSITYEADEANPSSEDMGDTIYKLQKRVDEYSTEANVYQEGDNRINVEIPGVTNADEILAELGTPGSLYFIAQTDADGNQNYTLDQAAGKYTLTKTIEDLEKEGSVVCSGSDVVSAEGGVRTSDTNTSEYVVSLTFSDEGAAKFKEATEKAFANGESIGIYYDGEFVSVPRVNAVISDGNIRIGGLKLTLNEIRSNVVGAQLGQTAIRTSIMGGAIGLAIVCVIMIVIYLVPGAIAAFVLVLYAALMLVLLNAFDLTLTLPGIAGIILSIGMAVDANVIIYARIREEIASGKTVKSSIDIGFKKALSAIIDGNVTTLIAAIVLNFMATGSVKGFAQTLALGIVLSMFTACVISRLLVNAAYAMGMKDEKYYGKAREVKTINFLGKRNLFFLISLVLVLSGPASMLINKAAGNGILNLSMEFRGGTSTDVTFNDDYSIDDIDAKIKPVIQEVIGEAEIQAQKVSGGNEVIFKTRALTVDEREDLSAKLDENFGIAEYTTESGATEKSVSFETISSTISNEMRKDAVVAVIIAVICMLIYIWFRFSDIRFGASAVLALVHDVLVVFACYAVVRISIGNTFIACMLTIVGYSINATIVIFDRIRENFKAQKKGSDLAEIVNRSITQTLTRSIYTSFTTFVTIAALYIIGVPSIKEFALPLMVGIVAGGYSSVCITGALWYIMKKRSVSKNSK